MDNRKLQKRGIYYKLLVMRIIFVCFIRHFFADAAKGFRRRSVAFICMMSLLLALFCQVSDSLTKSGDGGKAWREQSDQEAKERKAEGCDKEKLSISGSSVSAEIQTTKEPEGKPTEEPGEKPTKEPEGKPTEGPGEKTTKEPEGKPTEEPGEKPTKEPEGEPGEKPTKGPEEKPTNEPKGEQGKKSGEVANEQPPTARQMKELAEEANKVLVGWQEDQSMPSENRLEGEPRISMKPVGEPREYPEQTQIEKGKKLPDLPREEIIRVELPANPQMVVDTVIQGGESQVISPQMPIINQSDFPLEVDVSEAVIDIRQSEDGEEKDCSLNINILKGNDIVVAARNLCDGVNPIGASFCLLSGETANMSFSGCVKKGTETMWNTGDLSTRVVFQFRPVSAAADTAADQ